MQVYPKWTTCQSLRHLALLQLLDVTNQDILFESFSQGHRTPLYESRCKGIRVKKDELMETLRREREKWNAPLALVDVARMTRVCE